MQSTFPIQIGATEGINDVSRTLAGKASISPIH
jgi:hypothetical protein